MATISDIARAAGVSVESVLRVLNRDKVSEDIASRVRAVMDAYGFRSPQASQSRFAGERPENSRQEPAPESASGSLPELSTHRTDAGRPRGVVGDIVEWTRRPPDLAEDVIGRAREQLMQAVVQVAAELETEHPAVPSRIRHEALEVGPLAERMTVMDRLFERLLENVDGIKRELGRARSERLDDLTLVVDLITTSWRTVDQRLGRIERKLERMERPPGHTVERSVVSMSERRRGESNP